MGNTYRMATTSETVTLLRWRPQLSLGQRLRLIRHAYAKRRGLDRLSQDGFAAVLGVKEGTYGTWEADNHKPQDLVAFAQLVYERTGADPAWLLDVAEDHDSPPDQGVSDSGCNVYSLPVQSAQTERHLAAA